MVKEFRIVKQVGNSKPYSLYTFSNFNDCYVHLLELIQNQQRCVNKKYYVTNAFFKNKYPAFVDGIITYTIEVRKVEEWNKYIEDNSNYRKENKIVYLAR